MFISGSVAGLRGAVKNRFPQSGNGFVWQKSKTSLKNLWMGDDRLIPENKAAKEQGHSSRRVICLVAA